MKYLMKIKDERLRKVLLRAYMRYGYKLYFLPSSLTGKYHPKEERGLKGLEKHMDKVAWFVDKVSDEFQYSDEVRDILLTAAYFHDLGKVKQNKVEQEVIYEANGKIKRQVKVTRDISGLDLHPIISARMARKFLEKGGIEEGTISVICDLIAKHMSHWYSSLPRPLTELERMFALADFIVSRDEFKIEEVEGRWSKIKKKIRC